MPRALFIFGTRPEAIKLCPLVLRLRTEPFFEARVCVTGQHRGMLDQVLDTFGVYPDHDLNLMTAGQTLTQSTSRMLAALEPVIREEKPGLVIVQGDTTSTFCGALAAFYQGVPIAHVEAGLRTGDLRHPFPEEANRLLVAPLASLHFAATESAAQNLRDENIDAASISVTGNTGIDAVLWVRDQLRVGKMPSPTLPGLDATKRLIVVTAHRRENFGAGLERICAALRQLAARGDVQLIFPVHPNPNVRETVQRLLERQPNILLSEPLDYVPFVDLMQRAHILITDSGGVQEEGPSLGKPILVLREKTERPEAVAAGTVQLVGTDTQSIIHHAHRLLDSPALYDAMARIHNPYGDGQACQRITQKLREFFAGNGLQKLSAAAGS